MFFSARELELRKIRFDVKYAPGELDLLDRELRQLDDLQAQGVAELLHNTLGEIRISGRLRAILESPCDRCLEPAIHQIDSNFDLFYRPAETCPQAQETEIVEGECEIGFYENGGLHLEEALREYILLALPMQRLCRPDCKGLCPACGADLNRAPCGCLPRRVDDRWAALKNW